MAAFQPFFSPKQVAKALDASESSVKRWCDQGAIETVRTVGGHRKISLDALQRFLEASNRTLANPQLIGLRVAPQSTTNYSVTGDREDQIAFRKLLADGDELACGRILRDRIQRSGAPRSRVADFFITDAMHGIGDAWDKSELDAYQERRGCEICLRLIHELRSSLPLPSPTAPIAVGGTLSGDPYQIPTALVELSLREMGWNATNLGCELPVESFLRAANDYQPTMIWISVSTISDEKAFTESENRLVDGLPTETAVVLGGRALASLSTENLQYSALCNALGELTDFAHLLSASQSA